MAGLDMPTQIGWLTAEMLEIITHDGRVNMIEHMLRSRPYFSSDNIDQARASAVQQLCEAVNVLEDWQIEERGSETLEIRMAETMVMDGCADTMLELMADHKGLSYEQFHQIKKRAVQRLHERANILDAWEFAEVF